MRLWVVKRSSAVSLCRQMVRLIACSVFLQRNIIYKAHCYIRDTLNRQSSTATFSTHISSTNPHDVAEQLECCNSCGVSIIVRANSRHLYRSLIWNQLGNELYRLCPERYSLLRPMVSSNYSAYVSQQSYSTSIYSPSMTNVSWYGRRNGPEQQCSSC